MYIGNLHWAESSVLVKMWLPSLSCLRDQRATISVLTSLLLGLGLGLLLHQALAVLSIFIQFIHILSMFIDFIPGFLLRHALGGGDEWESETLVWLSLPGNLFMRTLTCLSMPLVLPKLITSVGSMDLQEGGKTLGRVLLFYAALNIMIETSGVLIFHAVVPNNEELLSINKTESDYVASHLPFSFAIQDLAFNIAPDNVFTAPFRRFRTQVDNVEGKTTYSDGFSFDPNILGLVIVSSALGVAIAK